ncbi:hypothetical protein ZWY2020_035926 [Hordeum vulgare]|nr:hypothetical protein ZWY2020_035926 [Hordeum vulgare]
MPHLRCYPSLQLACSPPPQLPYSPPLPLRHSPPTSAPRPRSLSTAARSLPKLPFLIETVISPPTALCFAAEPRPASPEALRRTCAHLIRRQSRTSLAVRWQAQDKEG